MPWGLPGSPVIPLSSSGLSYAVFKGIMKKGYKVPTPIQRKVRGGEGWWGGEDGRSDLTLFSASWWTPLVPAVTSVVPLTLKPHKLATFTGGESWAQQRGDSTLGLFAT